MGRQLTIAELNTIEERRMLDGKMPRVFTWGSYSEERHELAGLQKRSLEDFKYRLQGMMV